MNILLKNMLSLATDLNWFIKFVYWLQVMMIAFRNMFQLFSLTTPLVRLSARCFTTSSWCCQVRDELIARNWRLQEIDLKTIARNWPEDDCKKLTWKWDNHSCCYQVTEETVKALLKNWLEDMTTDSMHVILSGDVWRPKKEWQYSKLPMWRHTRYIINMLLTEKNMKPLRKETEK